MNIPVSWKGKRAVLLLNAKGSTFEVISWLGLLIVALIAGYWFFSNFNVSKGKIETIENDLHNLRALIDDACDAKTYYAKYNPFTEDGNLEIRKGEICITAKDAASCRLFLCETAAGGETFNLSETRELEIVKENNGSAVKLRVVPS
jgi:hypothetical protein